MIPTVDEVLESVEADLLELGLSRNTPTRVATEADDEPVEMPKLQAPRLPTGVDGEGVPPVYGVRRG